MEFYGNGHDELHGGFNFVFLNAALEADALRAVVEETEATPARRRLADMDGFEPRRLPPGHHGGPGGDPAKVRLRCLVLLTLRGTPFLYQGDEIGLADGPIEPQDLVDPVGIRYWPVLQGARRGADADALVTGPGGGFTEPGVRTWLPMADPAQCNVAAQRATPIRSWPSPGAPSRGAPGATTWPSARTAP